MSLYTIRDKAGKIVGYRGELEHGKKRLTRRWRLRPGITKTMIKAAHDEWVVKLRRGELLGAPPDPGPTFAEFAPLYLADAKASHSIDWYDRKVRAIEILTGFFGSCRLSQISRAQVAAYRQERLKHIGKVTVNMEVAILSHVFKVAIDWSRDEPVHTDHGSGPKRLPWRLDVQRNPATGMLIKRASTFKGTYIKPAPAEAFFRFLLDGRAWPPAPGDRWADAGRPKGKQGFRAAVRAQLPVFYLVALTTGLRRKELARLDWRWVDLEAGMIDIPRQKSLDDRRVPLTPSARAALSVLPGREGPVFMMPNTYWALVRQMKIFGLPTRRLHDLRHTWATNFRKSGADLHLLKELGGWRTWTMLEKYDHVDDGDRRRAADQLENHMRTAADPGRGGGVFGGTSPGFGGIPGDSVELPGDAAEAATRPETAIAAPVSRR